MLLIALCSVYSVNLWATPSIRIIVVYFSSNLIIIDQSFWWVFDFQKEGKAIPEASVSFHRATPSMTHMALVALEKAGILKFVISQVGQFYLFLAGCWFDSDVIGQMKHYQCIARFNWI